MFVSLDSVVGYLDEIGQLAFCTIKLECDLEIAAGFRSVLLGLDCGTIPLNGVVCNLQNLIIGTSRAEEMKMPGIICQPAQFPISDIRRWIEWRELLGLDE